MAIDNKPTAGYRLHKKRILFSGGEVIRTIKYPIVPQDNSKEEQLKKLNHFKDLLINDDLKIRGDININDYLNYSSLNKNIYTLFDFWIDSLKVGVIWVPKTADLFDFVSRFYDQKNDPTEQIWNNADPNFTKFFNKELFKKLILSGQVRTTRTKNSFRNELIQCLKDEYKVQEKDKGENIGKNGPNEAMDLINYIVGKFFNDNDKLALKGEEQKEFWKNEYRLDKSILENAIKKSINNPNQKSELGRITFLIIPELMTDPYSNTSLEELINKRKKWLEEKKVNEKNPENQLKLIIGLDSEFNGFSNYFGSFLRELQKSKIEEIYTVLKSFLPALEKNEEKIKSSLKFLSKKAIELGNPSLPLISSWADYRSLLGGKIQSWFSNFLIREKEMDKQIISLQESLHSTKNLIKTKNFDSNQKSEEEIKNIEILLSRLIDFDNEKIKLESGFLVFNSLLSSLKRRLNFFYQNYLQEEGEDEKNVTDIKEFKGLYEKIYKPVAFFGQASKKANKKFIEKTIWIIDDGIEIISSLLDKVISGFNPVSTFDSNKRKDDNEEDNYRRLLSFIFNKIQDQALNSQIFKNKYIDILKKEFIKPTWQDLIGKKNKKNMLSLRVNMQKAPQL